MTNRKLVSFRYSSTAVEALETRLMLAGNITASVSKGILTITGSADADHVTVQHGISAGSVHIAVNNGTVNDLPSVEFSGITKDIRVFLGGGSDLITFHGLNGANAIPRGLFVETADGDDVVSLSETHVKGVTKLILGTGRDILRIDDSRFEKKTTLDSGADDDGVLIDRLGEFTEITQFENRLSVLLGDGNDVLRIGIDEDNSRQIRAAKKSKLNGGAGTDTVALSLQSQILAKESFIEAHQLATLPKVNMNLANDTAPNGVTNDDHFTNDPGISGNLVNFTAGSRLIGGNDDSLPASFVDLSTTVQPNGTIALTDNLLELYFPGVFIDGQHTLHLQVIDTFGEKSDLASLTFTLDTIGTVVQQFGLDPASNTGTLDDLQTTIAKVNLKGKTAPGAVIELIGKSLTATADISGNFEFAEIQLMPGGNQFHVRTTDASGNHFTTSRNVELITAIDGSSVVEVVNQAALAAIKLDATSPPLASRNLALIHVAILDAVGAILNEPRFLVSLSPPIGASPEASVIGAGFELLSYLYPGQQPLFEALRAGEMAKLPDDPSRSNGEAFGIHVAQAVIALREDDGWDDFYPMTDGTTPGEWQTTAPMHSEALLPQWADLTPFAMIRAEQFQADGPPALESAEYAQAYNEVLNLGRGTDSSRTPEQTQIARFWADGAGTFTPSGHWNHIAQIAANNRMLSLWEHARLFGVLNVALADAGIAAWNTKYEYNFWRPITAITEAANDGNSVTAPDDNWQPYLITPPFPEYISGHSTFSGAAAEVLTRLLGDNISFTSSADGFRDAQGQPVLRSFDSFWDAAEEAGQSRIYGGIHYQFSNQDGLDVGRNVGTWVVDRFSMTEDISPPNVVITSPSNNLVIRGDLMVHGSVLDNLSGVASAEWQLDNGAFMPLTIEADGDFALPVILATNGTAEGAHTLRFRSADQLRQVSPIRELTFTLDTRDPTISFDNFTDGIDLSTQPYLTGIVDGTGSAIVSLKYWFDTSAPLSLLFDHATGRFGELLDLSRVNLGAHNLHIEVRDAAGNTTTHTFTTTLSTLPPFGIRQATPRDGSEQVGSTFRPQVFFTRPIDPASLNATNFFATNSTGTKLPATIVPSLDGSFAWLFFASPLPGGSTITVHVDGSTIRAAMDNALLDGNGDETPGGSFEYQFTTVSLTPLPATSLSGILADPGPDLHPGTIDDILRGPDGLLMTADDVYLHPIAGATISILGLDGEVVITDSEGRFMFDSVPAGDIKLAIDGRTASNAPVGIYFPEMVMDLKIRAGVANTVMAAMEPDGAQASQLLELGVYLPRLEQSILRDVSTTGITMIGVDAVSAPNLTPIERQLLTLEISPNSLVGADGQPLSGGQVGISTVPPELVRDMLPPGLLQHTFDITVQAPGITNFATPAKMTFPNVFNAEPGTKLNFLSFDHTTGRLVIEGTGTVSEDGLVVTTDPETGITHPGWHGLMPPGSQQLINVNNTGGDLDDDGDGIPDDLADIDGDGQPNSSDLDDDNDGEADSQDSDKNNNGIDDQYEDSDGDGEPDPDDADDDNDDIPDEPEEPDEDENEDAIYRAQISFAAKVDIGANLKVGVELPLSIFENVTPGSLKQPWLFELSPTWPLIDITEEYSQTFTIPDWAEYLIPEFSINLFDLKADIAITGSAKAQLTVTGIDGKPKAVIKGELGATITVGLTVEISNSFACTIPLGIGNSICKKYEFTKEFDRYEIEIKDVEVDLPGIPIVDFRESLGPILEIKIGAFTKTSPRVSVQKIENTRGVAQFTTSDTMDTPLITDLFTIVDSHGFNDDPRSFYRYVLADGQEIAGQSTTNGDIEVFLPDNIDYNLTIWSPKTNRYTIQQGKTGPSGSTSSNSITLGRRAGLDFDRDGLPDIAEFVVGTDLEITDTDGDGLSDLAEIEQGLDPLSGRPVATGIVSSIPLEGVAREVVLEGSILNGAGQIAYVATGSYGLAIVDVTQFQQPIVLSQLDLEGDSGDVSVDAALNIAAVASTSGLLLVDIADPLRPQLIRTVSGVASQVEVHEGIAYVAVGNELRSYDLFTGEQLHELDLLSTVTGLARVGKVLYTMDVVGDLKAIEITTSGLVVRDTLSETRGTGDIFVGGGIAYLGAESGGLGGFATANVADPDNLSLISGVDAVNLAGKAIAVNGSGLAVTAGNPTILGNVLQVMNVGDAGNTNAFLTQYLLPSAPFDIAIGGGLGFVADGASGLVIVNYSPFDKLGQPPTATLAVDAQDADSNVPGIQVFEGANVLVMPSVTDDIQVRLVELLVNGEIVARDVSFPYELSVVAPNITSLSDSFTVQVRATDTGGNVGLSSTFAIQLVSDIIAPTLIGSNVAEGDILNSNARRLEVQFSEPLSVLSTTPDDFSLIGPDGFAVPVGLQFRYDDRSIQLTYPELKVGNYEFILHSSGITDRAGNSMSGGERTVNFTVSAGTVSWMNPAGGFWDDPANWSTGIVPSINDDVVIDVVGSPTIQIRTGSVRVQSLISRDALTLTGGQLTVDEILQMEAPLTLDGGTLSDTMVDFTNGAFIMATANGNNHLSAVTVNGDILLPSDSAFLTVSNGIALLDGGTVRVSGSGATVVFNGTQTWTTGAIEFSGSNGIRRVLGTFNSGNTTLTLGEDFQVRGGFAVIPGSGLTFAGFNLINQGSIVADSPGQELEIRSDTFSNSGTLQAINGSVLSLGQTITNSGTISTLDSTLNLGMSSTPWSNSGTITATNSTVNLGGNFNTASMRSFRPTGGQVNIVGTLDNTDDTLLLDNVTGSWSIDGGMIQNGKVVLANGQSLFATSNSKNRLNGVIVDGDLVLSELVASIEIINGISLINGGAIRVSGSGARVFYSGTQTWETGTLEFSGTDGFRRQLIGPESESILTLGQSFLIRGENADLFGSGLNLINRGRIWSDISGGTLGIRNLVSTTGSVRASVGSTVHVYDELSQLSSGEISVEIGGNDPSQQGRISTFGNANLDGTLSVTFVNNFTPTVDASFSLITYHSRTGQFSNINHNLPPGLILVPSYTGNQLTLTVADALITAGLSEASMLTRPSFDLEDSKTILAMSSVNLNAACPSLDKRRTLRIDITNQLLGVLAAAGLNDVWMGDDMPGWNGSVDAKPYAFAESEAVAIIPGLIAIPPNTRNNTDLRTVIAHELSQEPGFDLDSELNHVESETLDPQIVDQAFFADFLTNHLR